MADAGSAAGVDGHAAVGRNSIGAETCSTCSKLLESEENELTRQDLDDIRKEAQAPQKEGLMATVYKRASAKRDLRLSWVMENVNSKLFPVTALEQRHTARRWNVINMPGTHGTCTQDQTAATGKAVSGMIRWYMGKWGTDLASLGMV